MIDKVAITVERGLLEKIESLRRRTNESRSAVFARAARLLLQEEENRRKVERYVQAYREQPETDADVARAEAIAKLSFEGAEWDE